jgi:hypothetical protein
MHFHENGHIGLPEAALRKASAQGLVSKNFDLFLQIAALEAPEAEQ